jgi:hypothetical protein
MVALMHRRLDDATSSARGLQDGFCQLARALMQVSEQLRCMGVQITVHCSNFQRCGEQAEVLPEGRCQSNNEVAKDLLDHRNGDRVLVGAHINQRRLLV